jgi:hypothetical protein
LRPNRNLWLGSCGRFLTITGEQADAMAWGHGSLIFTTQPYINKKSKSTSPNN